MHIAAWTWLAYLAVLACIDWFIYPRDPQNILRNYYLVNGSIALVFLGCSYWTWLRKNLKNFYVPFMLFINTGVLIIVNRLWIHPFPDAPLSNIEGMALRLLPILFIGLIIAAWRYSLRILTFFLLGSACLDFLLIFLKTPMRMKETAALMLVVIIRTASFFVVGIFLNRLILRLRSQQEELKQANEKLVDYAGTVEQLTISRERNRLARELHDTLAHTLSGLSVQLETAQAYWDVEPKTAHDLLKKSLEATRSGLDETRRALKAMRASSIEDLGLILALRKLAESASGRGKLDLTLKLPEKEHTFTRDVEQCVYRIAQEAIENVIHHANAKILFVQLLKTEGDILLTIEDDGTGFDENQIHEEGHYGLEGMRERAQIAGGQLSVHSQGGQGTRVQLTLKG